MKVLCYTKQKTILAEFEIANENIQKEVLGVISSKRKSINTYVLKEFFTEELEEYKEFFGFALVVLP